MTWFRPRSALWWTYALICLAGSIGLVLQMLPSATLTWSGILIGLPFMVVTLLVVGAFLSWLDLFRDHVRIRVALAMGFVWGAAAGPGIAIFANDNLIHVIRNLTGEAFAVDWQASISASIVEEGVKGAGVLAVAWLFRSQLHRPMHGLLLGGFTGLGFQLTEDATYQANAGLLSAQGDLGSSLLVAILRLLTGVTSHWMLTGIAGIGIVTAVGASTWSPRRRAATLVTCYLLGAAMHFGWDAPISGSGIGTVLCRIVLYALIFTALYRWVVRIDTRWFRSVVDWAVAQHLAPPGELHTLVSRRSRRRARRALRLPHRIAVPRRHELLDWVQAVDARLGGTGGAILGQAHHPTDS
ncbi:PrsW family intramembrane metalloprotease [Nocardia macrotermitis]|uniref:PrsW family intramembrane metalloprotease n=1 Tax=Nocardia macrotermitis TaxID=2585198 RepID=A0A7K0DB20_9NOCA|nr:PrsW family intramembrane metalloprotease [Nocardia macrotermitis]MQY22927.1 hypothetical protein [Nocardia macrotermitis]